MSVFEKGADALVERFGLEFERLRDEVRAGLSQTRNALRVSGHRPVPIIANATATTEAGRLVGWTIRETSGTNPATVEVYGSRGDASGDLLLTIQLTAGTSTTHIGGLPGVSFGDGAFVAVTGAVKGSLFLGVVD